MTPTPKLRHPTDLQSEKSASSGYQRLPLQRWQIAGLEPELGDKLAKVSNLSLVVAQILINRGMNTPELAKAYLEPESCNLPLPSADFPDLSFSVKLLQEAIAKGEKIAICGDYDADGMTSTALLLRALRSLGAMVDYAIPSRMHEGYGINVRIIEEFAVDGVKLVLTVDNGISAVAPIARAKELGLKVIVTDHHDLPEILPPADAILNPKLIAETSPYRGIAGVGVAYILAVSLAQALGKTKGLVKPLLELFTLGTIADLAPLTGVNRRWLKRGLRLLPESELAGVQALIQLSGVKGENSTPSTTLKGTLKPEDIGFRLGPRINAVGRIADPQIVIDLLTTDEMGLALEKAMNCEQINQRRQQLCEEIEQEAVALVEKEYLASLESDRVLLLVQPNWHHGVIGIVASRLVERYGAPVFIATYEDDTQIRGSARGIPEFDVFAALNYSQDLLGKYGGHYAAGGFSLPTSNLAAWRERSIEFARQSLQPQHLKPLIYIDAQANLPDIDLTLFQELETLQPCGIGNREPVFWTHNVRILEQRLLAKGHIKLRLTQDSPHLGIDLNPPLPVQFGAIAWRWGEFFPLPPRLDIAYKLRLNTWQGQSKLELELVGARSSI
ncbi:single-stranded-DNA-specific exonuclease RecJ [Merismopedia glauca]|uniref:Single-stranded-DNA-specific exonuclease RecJ n=1 Tax=Merismopedia glauca CCAP 1448/3 TaxID=1296344 RepID=A0A2T1BYQ9_9CYAN|nr:single-stranded-DNA-specific exonuclease RecJ [Merismopedia glauca CCAP 1448/3]